MIGLFLKKYLRTPNGGKEKTSRNQVAKICSLFGIALNLILFAGKITAGMLSGSIAIQSDAFNNLSDAGASLITLFGISLSAKKPDPEHPFGHGRMEYLSALAVSAMIIYMGFELAKESVGKILKPEPMDSGYFYLTLIILSVSVLVKCYMWHYNRTYGKKIHSSVMVATATDSLSDAAATFVVLVSNVIAHFTQFDRLDGICGLLVSFFIFFAGFRAAKETLVPLLGQPPKPEFIAEIEEIVMAQEEIIGIHDLIVHDYGPGRVMISLHAEVPADGDFRILHDVIDNTEGILKEKLNCEAVIHLDPIDNKDPVTLMLKEDVQNYLKCEFPDVSIHDFRVAHGKSHTNLIFDVVKPYQLKTSDKELCKKIREFVLSKHPNHYCVIKIDNDYNSLS